jgi:hypothetical protein
VIVSHLLSRTGSVLVRVFLAGVACLPAVPVLAVSQDYVLEFPARQMIAYKIEFQVPNPGRLSIEMNWSSNRVVSFKVEGPDGGPPELRRSGPPPLRLHFDVDEALAGTPGPWKLSIRGLPTHEAAAGELTMHLPDARDEIVPEREGQPSPPDSSLAPWLQSRPVSRSGPPALKRLHRATEEFRFAVVEQPGRDRYAWQEGFLRYMAERRDGTEPLPDAQTTSMLRRSAEAVRRVQKLEDSRDPFVVDPPEDPGLNRAWLTLRRRRLEPLELELDSMLYSIHKGHVPSLVPEQWFGRFMTCLIACEQHFEERGRVGESRASNGDVVDEQWDRLLLAAEVLDSLADLAEPNQR